MNTPTIHDSAFYGRHAWQGGPWQRPARKLIIELRAARREAADLEALRVKLAQYGPTTDDTRELPVVVA